MGRGRGSYCHTGPGHDESSRIPGERTARRRPGSRSRRGSWSPTPEEAAAAYDALGGGLIVVKAQVHAGRPRQGGGDRPRATTATQALEIASGQKPRPDGDGQGRAARQVGRGGRGRRRQPARQDAGHLPDRRRGPGDLQGAGDRRPRHRPRALPRHGDRPRPAVPGADGLDRGGRRDRDRRPRDPREDPPRADRRRPRPGRLPGAEGLQGARA